MTENSDDLWSVFSSAGVVFVGRVLERILSLFGLILIVRTLSRPTFGDLAFTYTIMGTLSTILTLGLFHGVTRVMSSKTTDSERVAVLVNGVYLVLFSGTIGILMVYLLRFQISAFFDNPQVAHILILLLPIAFFGPLSKVLASGLRSFKITSKTILFRDVLSRGMALLVLILFFVVIDREYGGTILYWNLLSILTIILLLYLLVGVVRQNGGINPPSLYIIKDLVSFSWPLAISSSFIILLRNIDIFMVGFFLSSDSVALYRAIQGLNQIPLFVLQSFVFLYLPVATEAYTDGNIKFLDTMYKSTTKWISIFTYPMVVVVILFSDDVIRVMFTDAYVTASAALSILVGSVYLRSVVGPNGATVNAIGRSEIEMWGAIAGLVTNFALNVVLIPRYGIEGAALATGLSFLVYNSVEILFIHYITGIHPFTSGMLKPFVPTTVILVSFAVLTRRIRFGLGLLGVIGIAAAILHLISVVLTRSFDESDIELLSQIENELGIELKRIRIVLER